MSMMIDYVSLSPIQSGMNDSGKGNVYLIEEFVNCFFFQALKRSLNHG